MSYFQDKIYVFLGRHFCFNDQSTLHVSELLCVSFFSLVKVNHYSSFFFRGERFLYRTPTSELRVVTLP